MLSPQQHERYERLLSFFPVIRSSDIPRIPGHLYVYHPLKIFYFTPSFYPSSNCEFRGMSTHCRQRGKVIRHQLWGMIKQQSHCLHVSLLLGLWVPTCMCPVYFSSHQVLKMAWSVMWDPAAPATRTRTDPPLRILFSSFIA